MPHIISTSANETIGEEVNDYHPVLYDAFAQFVSRNTTKRFRGDMLFMSTINLLFSFVLSMAGSRAILSFDHFSIVFV